MTNIKSAIKRIRTAKRNEAKNRKVKSTVKTYLKKAIVAISGKKDDVEKMVREAIKNLDKAVSKGVLHKKTASRKKSRLMKLVNKKAK